MPLFVLTLGIANRAALLGCWTKDLGKLISDIIESFKPSVFPYPGFALAMVVGGIGGWVFATLKLPLPWMLGSMLFCTFAAVGRLPIASPVSIRRPTITIIGVMLGAGFTPQLLVNIWTWLPTVIGVSISTIACGIVCVAYFKYVAKFDDSTAYFSGMPGGVVEMVLLGEQYRANIHQIALVQASRIFILVFALPFVVQMILGISLGERPAVGQPIVETPASSFVLLIATAITGYYLGPIFRLPAPQLTGPMFLSGIAHVAGLTDFKPSTEIINIAQVILGGYIGTSFRDVRLIAFLKLIAVGLGSAALLLVTTISIAYLTSLVSNYGLVPLLLAFSPGGVVEMSLVALALNIEVAFVACHHLVRVLIVLGGAAVCFEWLWKPDRQPP